MPERTPGGAIATGIDLERSRHGADALSCWCLRIEMGSSTQSFSPGISVTRRRWGVHETRTPLVLALQESYVQGVATRKVKKVTEKLCGTSFSKSLVSKLCQDLDAEIEAWRNRPLTQCYPYLIVDARYEHIRDNGRVLSKGVLVYYFMVVWLVCEV
jgi:hypothetical protein